MIYSLLLENFILPIGDKILGTSFIRGLQRVRMYDKLNEEELEHLQQEKLAHILDYAVKNSTFYNKYQNKKVDDPVQFLKSFPILTKEILRDNIDLLLTQEKNQLIKQNSSGSSGLQTTVFINKSEQSIQRAYQIRWWEWSGYNLGDPILQTGITINRGWIKKLKDIFFHTYYISAYAHSEDTTLSALKWASKKKNIVLAGYASSLYVLARIAKKRNVHIYFKTAISWGDKLFNQYRNEIETVFNTHLHETYASTEGFMIAAQKDIPYMYIMSTNIFIELLDDEGNEVTDGEIGHVVVTKLDGYSMPMIRYQIGDLAIKLPREKYPKQREYAYPLLEKVIGRDTDIVKTHSGKFMVVHSFTGIVEHFPEIKQFCVIQKELYGITIQYIKGENFTTDVLNVIKKNILTSLDENDFYINFESVDYIPATASGKPQIIQSFLNKNEIN